MDNLSHPASGRIEAIHELSNLTTTKARRFLLTVAQNNTPLHEAFWQNLIALKRHYRAELLVSRCTYNKRAWANKAKPGSKQLSDYEDLWYDDRLRPFFSDERVTLADGLVWCGDLNILPTAVDPLCGLLTLTGAQSCVIPHTKIALRCVPSGRHQDAKFVYTTGAVTQRNYIQQKSGQKADFHHCYGALLVEVDDDGDWFCRQVNATNDGEICDLNIRVRNGKVSRGLTVEAINWGDIHVAELEDAQRELCWGPGGILDTFRPKYQFMHDVLDFKARDIHVKRYNSWHSHFRDHVEGFSSVEAEVDQAAAFLAAASRPWAQTVCVASNHNDFLFTWLQRDDFRDDPENAVYWLELQLATYRHYARNPTVDFNLFRHAIEKSVKKMGLRPSKLRVLDLDESFIICPNAGGGIECGMHGDKGPNGARGNHRAFANIGLKANVGHEHTAAIYNGIYVAGVTASLDQRYNRGPSSWSHSHVLTYCTGKRAIITTRNGKCKA